MDELRKPFHQQLQDIQADLIRMGARVIDALPRVTDALLGDDQVVQQAIIDGDDELDTLTLSVEDQCFTLLARQQPVAGDMRALVTALRMCSEIERSGDLVVNIAKGAQRIRGTVIPPRLRGLIQDMSQQSARLFDVAIEAYERQDADLAAELDDLDDALDIVHREFIAAMVGRHDRDLELQPAVQLALIGRYYERIGDHAVNVGERVRYMVTGWLPEPAAARAEGSPQGGPGGTGYG
ncbi:MAG: phosphate signaling complex protein PhoU [Acidimicrobiia bacterium]